ncbi:GPI transamidase component PIG-S [Ctenocephalides felis]|uniref:GPI transamidase component PIG-S n=1 Tax=Ctenocephalides felis TaxID=7515 RepID=UPI000E6E2DC1|nr:GPI transamidase component PIG-S [Ctenocephalides felis]
MPDDTGKVPYVYETYRMLAAVSFAVTLIVIGIPLWWYTTDVYRVPLPYSGIDELKNINFQVSLNIYVACREDYRADLLVEELDNKFTKSDLFNITFKRIIIPLELLQHSKTPAILENALLKNIDVKVGDFIFIEWYALKDEILVTSDRSAYFSPATSSHKIATVLGEWILGEDSLKTTLSLMRSHSDNQRTFSPAKGDLEEINGKGKAFYSNNIQLDANARRRVPPSSAYDVMITVVNPNPEELTADLDIRSAANDYIVPFLNELSSLANFTVKSQWLYFLELDYKPKQVIDSSILRRHFALPEEILPHLITPLEKKLASHVSNNPCLNLVIYLPSCKTAPLHIYTKSGTRAKSKSGVDAFLSPRWGGVVISNPSVSICENALIQDNTHVTFKPDTSLIMGTFLHQLRLLLGIMDNSAISGASIVELESLSPRSWELDALKRVRTLEHLTSASLTLQSIAQLLDEINNIVINDDIGESIIVALEECHISKRYLEEGLLDEAFKHSKIAFTLSELAFTDQSLLALLYFPDDQKYAVYIPLFLPIMIPVILSFGTLKRWLQILYFNKEKTD